MDDLLTILNGFFKGRKSIVGQFMYHYIAIVVVIIVTIFCCVATLGHYFVYKEKEAVLMARCKEVSKGVDFFLGTNDHDNLYRYIRLADRLTDSDIWIFDTDTDIVAVSSLSRIRSNVARSMPAFEELPLEMGAGSTLLFDVSKDDVGDKVLDIIKNVSLGESYSGIVYQKYYGEDVLIAASPYYDRMTGKMGAVILAVPTSYYQGFINYIYLTLLLVGLFSLVLSVCFTKRLATHVVSPVVRMKEFAIELAKGEYGSKIEIDDDSEINDLGKALNTLSNDMDAHEEVLNRQEKIRKDFVANVSHELKTPITIIRGYNDALIDGVIKEEEKKIKYRNMIHEETVRMENLVKDLLNMSRLENADPWQPEHLRPVDINLLCNSVAERLAINCIKQNNIIKVNADDGIEMLGDGDQLFQLILILADNALKYSPQNGTVLICAHRTDDDGLVLSVSDEGPGIPEEDIEFIWDRFYMVDKSRNRKKVSGTGLGLAIAKQIIRIHGAEAHVTSKLGEGTKFEIKFSKDKIV